MNSLVSVIVPIYNIAPEYLNICIKSILSQSYEDIELLLVDDGSEGFVESVCKEYLSDSRVKYLRQENRGVSVARNNGLDHANGDFIMFADGDDYLSEDAVKQAVLGMKDYDLLFFGYYTTYTNRENYRVMENPNPDFFESERIQLAILQGDKELGMIEFGAPWGKLIRKSVIEDNALRYTEGLRKGQDTVFTLHLLEHCKKIGYAPFAGYHYRISTSSISHRYNPEIIAIMEKTLDAYSDFAKTYKKDDRFEKAISNKCYKAFMNEYLDLYFLNKNNPESVKKNRKAFEELMKTERYAHVIACADIKKMSVFEKFEYGCIKNRLFALLWMEKRFLMFLRSLLLKNYG